MKVEHQIAIADTNVASYAIRGESIALEYARLTSGMRLHMSFITAGELRYWAERDKWGARRRIYLDMFLSSCPVIPYADGIEKVFAHVMAERRRAGRRMEHADAWIAATALYHDLPLVTHDEDFAHTRGLRVITASEEVRTELAKMPPVRLRPPLSLDARCQCSA